MTITRTDIVKQVVDRVGTTKILADQTVGAVFEAIATGLLQRSAVRIPHFGTFRVTHHAARHGRNMRTGGPITIDARDVAKFVQARTLKEALNPPPSVPRRKQA